MHAYATLLYIHAYATATKRHMTFIHSFDVTTCLPVTLFANMLRMVCATSPAKEAAACPKDVPEEKDPWINASRASNFRFQRLYRDDVRTNQVRLGSLLKKMLRRTGQS